MALIYDKQHDRYHGIVREAKNLGVTPSHLSRYLRGERKSPRLDKLLKGKIKEVK